MVGVGAGVGEWEATIFGWSCGEVVVDVGVVGFFGVGFGIDGGFVVGAVGWLW